MAEVNAAGPHTKDTWWNCQGHMGRCAMELQRTEQGTYPAGCHSRGGRGHTDASLCRGTLSPHDQPSWVPDLRHKAEFLLGLPASCPPASQPQKLGSQTAVPVTLQHPGVAEDGRDGDAPGLTCLL